MKIVLSMILLISVPSYGEDLRKLNEAVEKLSPQQTQVYKTLADELRCPTCTGLSVLQSDAPFSVEIRTALVEQVVQGKSDLEILRFFKDRFGTWILRTPPKEGFHWMAWLGPLSLVLGGGMLVWFVFWRRRREMPSLGIRHDEDILREMHEELEKLRRQTR